MGCGGFKTTSMDCWEYVDEIYTLFHSRIGSHQSDRVLTQSRVKTQQMNGMLGDGIHAIFKKTKRSSVISNPMRCEWRSLLDAKRVIDLQLGKKQNTCHC